MPDVDNHDNCFSPTKFTGDSFLEEGSASPDLGPFKYLSSGAQAVVFKSFIKSVNGELPVVVRKINDGSDFDVHQAITRDESSTHSHHLLKIHAVKKQNGQIFAILPFCDATLEDAIPSIHALRKNNIALQNYLILHFLANTLMAMDRLHQDKKVIHRDIKPQNIGFYRDSWCLFDFDVSISREETQKTIFQGTYLYSHPAAYFKSELSKRPFNDVYALGTVLLNLLQPHFLKKILKNSAGFAYRQVERYKKIDQHLKDDPQKKYFFQLESYPVNTPEALHLSLIKLAKKMRSFNPYNTPSVLEIQQFVSNALATICNEALKTELSSFYSGLKDKMAERSFLVSEEESVVRVLTDSSFAVKASRSFGSFGFFKSFSDSPKKFEAMRIDSGQDLASSFK